MLPSFKQLREAGVLGMNNRNVHYVNHYNPRHLFHYADDKLATKELAQKHNIDAPELIGVIHERHQSKFLDKLLGEHQSFVIKPRRGSGGKGILVIHHRQGEYFIKPSGVSLDYSTLIHHVNNVLSGLHSLGGKPDSAIIEHMIEFNPVFEPYSYEGVPDVRVLVFQGYPVMAMLRCSTHASDGRANLHQGAVGVGLCLQSGRSVTAVQNGKLIDKHPDTDEQFSALQVPHWQGLLKLAASCYDMTKLGYLGCDIVIDQQHGPMVLELNARPGLAIQIANQAGLLRRLKIIEDHVVSNPEMLLTPEQRVALSQELFA